MEAIHYYHLASLLRIFKEGNVILRTIELFLVVKPVKKVLHGMFQLSLVCSVGVLPCVILLCQFYFAALYLMFAFQKDNMRRKAEERPEFEDRSETAKKRASEDGNDSRVSKRLKSTDPTVGAGGEAL